MKINDSVNKMKLKGKNQKISKWGKGKRQLGKQTKF